MLSYLLSKGSNVNLESTFCSVTPFYQTISKRKNDFHDVLISNGADVNSKNKSTPYTALHVAFSINNNHELIELLIRNGTEIGALTKWDGDSFNQLKHNGSSYIESATILVKEIATFGKIPVFKNDTVLIQKNPMTQ